MATVAQIYTIVNNIAKQTLGQAAVDVIDTTSMVSVGNDILKSDETVDLYVKALTDRIAKTIISIRGYMADEIGMIRHAFEYGIALQKIYVDLPQTDQNTSWLVGQDDFEPQYAPVIKPDVKQKIFSNATTFEIDITIPDKILRTAFTSPEGMAIMINAIFVAIDNRMKMALESCTELVRAAFIGRKIKAANKCGAINMLPIFNKVMGKTLTAAQSIYDYDFLRWSAVQIDLWTRRMRKMSTLFNDEGYKRHTPASEMVLTLLDEYDAALKAYMESSTYHAELVKIASRYNTVPYWQGSGEDYDFESTSAINVKLDAETTISQTGILAVAYDIQAMGIMLDSRVTTTERNSRSEYTNYYNKVTRGYFNDMSENGIVFYVADAV